MHSILVIGQFITQLETIAANLDLSLITRKTPHAERERLYTEFKAGRIQVLVVSKVANFAVDLLDASVLIQVSGTFGSRQEEAQRLAAFCAPQSAPPSSILSSPKAPMSNPLASTASSSSSSRAIATRFATMPDR
jgi:superfamily II DNA/RNA helicase